MTETISPAQFTHRILIQPLGLLYGSKGRFLSPENLVGRSGCHFPPDTPTLSGLFAAHYHSDRPTLRKLMLAGPFWAKRQNPANFYVPTPFHCLVQDNQTIGLLQWVAANWQLWQPSPTTNQTDSTPLQINYKKLQQDTWIAIADWDKVRSPTTFVPVPVETAPWKALPHLHPRLRSSERRSVGADDDRGSLFLEYGIQLDPAICLVYLSNLALPNGCYRFGGEGHTVQVKSEPIQDTEPIQTLLREDLTHHFALICPGVWGSNRLSYRAPHRHKDTGDLSWPDNNPVEALLTQRPISFRFRLGNQHDEQGQDIHAPDQPKLLSRGRYAVPSGSVYVLQKALQPWLQWPSHSWFPIEGYSFKRWGSALALPLA